MTCYLRLSINKEGAIILYCVALVAPSSPGKIAASINRKVRPMSAQEHLPYQKCMVEREGATHALIRYERHTLHSRGTTNSITYIYTHICRVPNHFTMSFSPRINQKDYIHSKKGPFCSNSEIPTNCGEVALGSSESHDFPTSTIYTVTSSA
jgi:hypothetical protein